MKKLVLFVVAAVVAVSVISCGNKKADQAVSESEAVVEQVQAAGDSVANTVDSLSTEVKVEVEAEAEGAAN